MKKLLIVLIIGMMSSCTEQTLVGTKTNIVLTAGDSQLEIVTIENCEYFKMRTDGFHIITHKGNCKNPIHPEHKRR